MAASSLWQPVLLQTIDLVWHQKNVDGGLIDGFIMIYSLFEIRVIESVLDKVSSCLYLREHFHARPDVFLSISG